MKVPKPLRLVSIDEGYGECARHYPGDCAGCAFARFAKKGEKCDFSFCADHGDETVELDVPYSSDCSWLLDALGIRIQYRKEKNE